MKDLLFKRKSRFVLYIMACFIPVVSSTLIDITVVNVSHIIFEETKMRYDKIFVVKNKDIRSLEISPTS